MATALRVAVLAALLVGIAGLWLWSGGDVGRAFGQDGIA